MGSPTPEALHAHILVLEAEQKALREGQLDYRTSIADMRLHFDMRLTTIEGKLETRFRGIDEAVQSMRTAIREEANGQPSILGRLREIEAWQEDWSHTREQNEDYFKKMLFDLVRVGLIGTFGVVVSKIFLIVTK